MLFKVFAVLGAISLLGGFADCQQANSNDLLKLVMNMMSSTAGTINSNENQLVQLLKGAIDSMQSSNQNEQMMQLVKQLAGSGTDASKSSENQMMQLLTNMMGGGGADAAKLNQNQIMQLMSTMLGGAKDSTKTNENQIIQWLSSMMGVSTDTTNSNEKATGSTNLLVTQILQLLQKDMMGNIVDTANMNDNQQQQLVLLNLLMNIPGINTNKSIKDALDALAKMSQGNGQMDKILEQLKAILGLATGETKKPTQCMAASKEKAPESVFLSWMEMLKVDSFKDLFRNEDDYDRFTDMVKYVKVSNKTDWLGALLKSLKANDWLMTLGEQIITMMENNKMLKDQVRDYIKENNDLLDFTVRVIEWMKLQDFSNSSMIVRKLVNIMLYMDLKESAASEEALYKNYMDWVDCTFGKQGEIATIMKTVGMLSKVDDILMPVLKNLIGSKYEDTINVTLQMTYNNLLRCDKWFSAAPQSLYDILILATTKKAFCATTSLSTFVRTSMVKQEQNTFIKSFGSISGTNTEQWRIDIYRDGKLVANDVDVNFMPRDGDKIFCNFVNK